MTMKWFAVLLVAGLTASVTSWVNLDYLTADGHIAGKGDIGFNEGDTATIRCKSNYTDAPYINATFPDAPFTSAKLEWQPYGSDTRVVVADGERIINRSDRFSGANLTDIGGNTVAYRVTFRGLDRYDNGLHFYCTFSKESGESTIGTGGLSSVVTVNWQRPSVQCKLPVDIEGKVKKGQDLSFRCSVTDADAKSQGSLSLWKNDEAQVAATATGSSADPVGTQYNVSYTIKVTEEVTKDEYNCRYSGIGGFEEYSSNCTFEKPDCVVDDLATPCPVVDDLATPFPVGGAVSEHDRVQVVATVGLSLLMMYWAV